MAKFKVGDKVIAKKGAPYMQTTDGWKGVVTSVDNDGMIHVMGSGAFGKLGFYVNSKYFDLETGCNQKIVITSDGRTTTAKLYDGKTVIKTAEAKCCESDKFDFQTGARLAIDRLLENEKTSFKKGDRVKITGNTNSHEFKIGSVVTIASDEVDGIGQWKCKGIDKSGKNDIWWVKQSEMIKVEGLDWEAFKASKIAVKVTKDNFKEFVAAAKMQGLKFKDNEEFNPFECAINFSIRFLAAMMGNKLDVKDNEIYIMYKDDSLKISHFFSDLEEFVWA